MTPEPKRPQLECEHFHVICALHGAPFRSNWPSGYPTYALLAMRKGLELPEIQEGSGRDATKVMALLKLKPVCCRLGHERLRALYQEVQDLSQPWKVDLCVKCHHTGLGSPVKMLMMEGYKSRDRDFRHLCFVCLTTRFTDARAN